LTTNVRQTLNTATSVLKCSGCLFTGTIQTGGYAVIYGGKACTIKNNKFSVNTNYVTAGSQIQIVATTGVDSIIGNTILNYYTAIYITGTVYNGVTHVITDNTITAASTANSIAQNKYIYFNGKDPIVIKRNKIYKRVAGSINSTDYTIYSKSTHISDIEDNYIDDWNYPSSYSINIDKYADSTVGACLIKNNIVLVNAKNGVGISLGMEEIV